MNNQLEHNKGLVKREDMAVVRTLDVLELSQGEFKDVKDARNGMLTTVGLERLRAAAKRQAQGEKAAHE